MDAQVRLIYAHLESGKGITAIDALLNYSCFRLAARIFDLRKRGVSIRTDWVLTNTGKRIAKYWLNN